MEMAVLFSIVAIVLFIGLLAKQKGPPAEISKKIHLTSAAQVHLILITQIHLEFAQLYLRVNLLAM